MAKIRLYSKKPTFSTRQNGIPPKLSRFALLNFAPVWEPSVGRGAFRMSLLLPVRRNRLGAPRPGEITRTCAIPTETPIATTIQVNRSFAPRLLLRGNVWIWGFYTRRPPTVTSFQLRGLSYGRRYDRSKSPCILAVAQFGPGWPRLVAIFGEPALLFAPGSQIQAELDLTAPCSYRWKFRLFHIRSIFWR